MSRTFRGFKELEAMPNPFDDPIKSAEEALLDQARILKSIRDQDSARQEPVDAWDAVLDGPEVDALLRLGKLLVSEDGPFWLDLWQLILERGYAVLNRPVAAKDRCRAVAIMILQAACRNEREAVCQSVESLKAFQFAFPWKDAFAEIRERLEDWRKLEGAPLTPHLTRQELIQCVENHLPGFSRANIGRMVRSKVLAVDQEVAQSARYCHADSVTHRKVLSCIVNYFKGKKIKLTPPS